MQWDLFALNLNQHPSCLSLAPTKDNKYTVRVLCDRTDNFINVVI